MRSVVGEGATIDDAIANALGILELERDKVEIEILENSVRGLLGIGSKRARVRATVRNPMDLDGETAAPVSQETSGDSAEVVISVLRRILDELGADAEVDVTTSSEEIAIAILGPDTGIVIGRHGQTLDAIEYFLSRILVRQGTQHPRVTIDVEGYRERRRETLEQTALRTAQKVRSTGRPEVLDPMSPRDRRIIHVALSENADVTTRSEGEGSYRRVVILPVRSPARS
jgi:spoIIIJ-associated protein